MKQAIALIIIVISYIFFQSCSTQELLTMEEFEELGRNGDPIEFFQYMLQFMEYENNDNFNDLSCNEIYNEIASTDFDSGNDYQYDNILTFMNQCTFEIVNGNFNIDNESRTENEIRFKESLNMIRELMMVKTYDIINNNNSDKRIYTVIMEIIREMSN